VKQEKFTMFKNQNTVASYLQKDKHSKNDIDKVQINP